MIPQFPIFKKLELSDKTEIDNIVDRHGAYSDFEFGSLWSWNASDDFEVSSLNGNLAVRFADYQTGTPFFMFIGDGAIDDTAAALIDESERRGYGDTLYLIPEVSAQLGGGRFAVEESRDQFDYVYDIGPYLTYAGSKFKAQRNFLNGFHKKHPNHQVRILALHDFATRSGILSLFEHWEGMKNRREDHEKSALVRFIDAEASLEHLALGVFVDDRLVAFSICALLPGVRANALFGKADNSYHGIGAFMMHELAKELMKRSYTQLNYQQDLGIEGLRKAKTAFHPVDFLKKYRISKRAA